jgi:hypothetical protein
MTLQQNPFRGKWLRLADYRLELELCLILFHETPSKFVQLLGVSSGSPDELAVSHQRNNGL